jgi:hypothetical protein
MRLMTPFTSENLFIVAAAICFAWPSVISAQSADQPGGPRFVGVNDDSEFFQQAHTILPSPVAFPCAQVSEGLGVCLDDADWPKGTGWTWQRNFNAEPQLFELSPYQRAAITVVLKAQNASLSLTPAEIDQLLDQLLDQSIFQVGSRGPLVREAVVSEKRGVDGAMRQLDVIARDQDGELQLVQVSVVRLTYEISFIETSQTLPSKTQVTDITAEQLGFLEKFRKSMTLSVKRYPRR